MNPMEKSEETNLGQSASTRALLKTIKGIFVKNDNHEDVMVGLYEKIFPKWKDIKSQMVPENLFGRLDSNLRLTP